MNFRHLNAKHGYYSQTPLSCHEPASTIGFVWERKRAAVNREGNCSCANGPNVGLAHAGQLKRRPLTPNRPSVLRTAIAAATPRSIRHQIIVAAQNALYLECGASRGVGISSARGQNT